MLAATALAAALFAPSGRAQIEEPQAPIKPPTDPLCALESDRYHVDFLRGHYCCPNRLEFWVEDKGSGRQGPLHVETQIRKAEKMTLVAKSKILVTGLLERDAKAIAIIDLESGGGQAALQDELHTFDYRLSPSQRFLVYSRRYPKGAGDDERRPLLLLYELEASPAENRAGQPAAHEIANAGRPIYPEANARQGSYDPKLEPPHRYLSFFLWSDDESKIVFFEGFEGKFYLVTLDLAQGWTPPQVRKAEIRLSDLAPDTVAPSEGLPIATLAWRDETTVTIQALIGGVFHDGVDVRVP